MKPVKKVRFVRRLEDADGGDAFVRDFRHGFTALEDGDVEAFGLAFVAGATSNEAVAELARDEVLADELGAYAIQSGPDDPEALDAS
jgi:hypothetical protein